MRCYRASFPVFALMMVFLLSTFGYDPSKSSLALTTADDARRQDVIGGQVAGFFRQPDISHTHVVFTCGGDLWTVPRKGGTARRLTDYPGIKRCPKFSPDGTTLAFVVDEPGDVIYKMAISGGRPRRLTYYPSNGIGVLGWSPDGKQVLFRSQRSWFTSTLHLVPAAGGLERELPMREGMFACYSPDGQRLAYNPSDGGGSTWKGYQGGNRAALKIYDLSADTCRDLATGSANDTYPMWRGDTLYFLSDRTGTLNLFARDLNSGAVQQLTDFHDFDVQTPSLGPDSIVFERARVLYVLDLGTKKVSELRSSFRMTFDDAIPSAGAWRSASRRLLCRLPAMRR